MTCEVVPGVWLGDWQLEDRIGRGGFAEVYRARRAGRPELAAVKIPRDPRLAEHLRREVRALRLDHPGVVRTLEEHLEHDPPFLVLELVEGGSLRQALADGPLAPARVVAWIGQLAEALEHAHAHGVLHLDIKPENVLLDREGRARLVDFGAGPPPGHDVLRESLVFSSELGRTGTHDYAAPELRDGGGTLDRRADVYGLGVLAFELLTGRIPIGLDRPSDLQPGLPRALDEVLARALARDPGRRTLSAGAFARELQAACAAAAPATRPGEPAPSPAPRPGRPRRALLLTALLALALAFAWRAGGLAFPPAPSWGRTSFVARLEPLLGSLPPHSPVVLLPAESLGSGPLEEARRRALDGALERALVDAGLRPVPAELTAERWGGLQDRAERLELARRAGAEVLIHAVLPAGSEAPEQAALVFLLDAASFEVRAATPPRWPVARQLAADLAERLRGETRTLAVLPALDAEQGVANATTAELDAQLTAALAAYPKPSVRARVGIVPRLRDRSLDARRALSAALGVEAELDARRGVVRARLLELEGGQLLQAAEAPLSLPAVYDPLAGAERLTPDLARLDRVDALLDARLDAALDRACALLFRGDARGALRAMESLQREGSPLALRPEFQALRARACAEAGDVPAALDLYQELVRQGGVDGEVVAQFARLCLREARRCYQAGKRPWYGNDDEAQFRAGLALLGRLEGIDLSATSLGGDVAAMRQALEAEL